jgi:hypothetical protein
VLVTTVAVISVVSERGQDRILGLAGGAVMLSASATSQPRVQLNSDGDLSTVARQGFNPGFIISDTVLYNGSALTESEIESFLVARTPHCAPGIVCLSEFRQDTVSRNADAICSAYVGEQNESAASIIAKVGRACGISQAALIVLLQKEQSLIDDPAPTARAFNAATGYACPDTADCDVNYAGFYNQVYWAAWQLKRYTNPPTTDDFFTWIPIDESHPIQYNPDPDCGASPVTVRSQATAGLYYYTPYQPDSDVLAGTDDAPCGAFGNLNFWRIYSAWFGSPTLGQQPVGALESTQVRGGGVAVSGWALDQTSAVSATEVEVTISRPGELGVGSTTLASEPSDLGDNRFPLAGKDHGFGTIVPFKGTGLVEVCASALPLPINLTAGREVLGCRIKLVLSPD